jgi:NAD(P)-dependent dehydrogenase (short-subunit alcohol dehydrogenase family)
VSTSFLDDLFGLTGKAAVVTGGGGLIGGEFCRGLARAGARVAVLGRGEAGCSEVARVIRSEGGEAIAVVADVLDAAALDRARDAVLDAFGGVDILVNTAGGPAAPASRLLPDQPLFGAEFRAGTRSVIDLNLLGPVLTIFAFGDALAAGDGGVIVNVSSNSARNVSSGVMGYSAAKAGLEQLTRWLAVEAARRYGGRLRVNAIAPGFTVGARNRDRFFAADGTPNERARAAIARIPAGRLGTPGELVPALLFLCAPASSYVTGQVVPVDGGHGLETGV